MKKVIIFILLVSSSVFADPKITVKVPVQLDKLPNNVKIDGTDVKYVIQCLLKDVKEIGYYGGGYYGIGYHDFTFNESHASDINETVTVTFEGAKIPLAKKIECVLGIKKITSTTSSFQTVLSNGIKNLPQIDVKKDLIIKSIE